MTFKFKTQFTLEERRTDTLRVLQKYPERIPVICERSSYSSNDCPIIDKCKYLVPRELTVGQFIYTIRKRMNMPSEKALTRTPK
jgi:GABA(A) receptor-associated protein